MFKLKPEAKKIWTDALRSGRYNQTRGALTKFWGQNLETGKPLTQGYCCLGVACEEGLASPAEEGLDEMGDRALVPGGMRDGWVMPSFLPKNIQENLIEMNDDLGVSFAGIADYVEANL